MDAHPPTRSPGVARSSAWLVAFMWGAYFLNYSDRQAVFAMFPALKSDLNLTDTQLGLTGSVFLWVYGFGCPLAGQIADRFSKRMLVVCSLAVWSLVTIGTGFANSAFMVLALRAAMGVSECLYMPAAIALTANAHAPEKRSRAIAVLTTAQIVGTVGGAWFGGWMAQRGQWRGAFIVLGIVGLLYAVPYCLFLRGFDEGRQIETKASGASLALWPLLKVPTYRVLCVAFPIFCVGLWLLYSWLPTFLHGKFGLGLSDAAFTATAFLQGATLVGMLAGGALADWLYLRTKASRLWLIAASLLLCAPCLQAIGSSETLVATRFAAAGFGLFSGLLMGNIFPAAFEIVPADTRASAVGVLNFCSALVAGFAPLLGGMWKQTVGIESLFTATAVAYVVGAVVVVVGIKMLFPRDYARIH